MIENQKEKHMERMDSGVADFADIVVKGVLCAIMTMTVGVDLGFLWGFSF